MRHWLVAVLGFAIGFAAGPGRAGSSRELVHAYPPGGPVEVAGAPVASKVLRTMQPHAVPAFTDVLALHVAHTLQGESHSQVAVTRKSRQGGNEAAVAVASAAPDGRTLLLASAVSASAKLEPVALVASMPFVLISQNDGSRSELLDLIRTGERRLLVGTAGENNAGHLAIERLRALLRSVIDTVPYNGGIAGLQAVATRQVRTALLPLPAVLPYFGAGRVSVLTIAEPQRHPRIHDVPTSAEAGLPGLHATTQFGVFAPAATPRPVIYALRRVLAAAPPSEQTREVFFDYGLRLKVSEESRKEAKYRPHSSSPQSGDTMTTTHSRTVQTRRRKAKAKKKDLREAKQVKKLGNAKAKAGGDAKAGAA